MKDIDTYFGVSAAAEDQWDPADRPEAPVIGDYVSVYFPRAEWQTPFNRFSTDIRPPLGEVSSWSFAVLTASSQAVDLHFNELESVPNHYDVILYDRALDLHTDLRENSTYSLVASNESGNDRFEIQVGPSAGDVLPDLPSEKHVVSLGHFPNPSAGSTTLHFSLPTAQVVHLDIYDILGRKVVTLVQNEWKNEGRNVILWDGRDESGLPLRSGTYFSWLTTEEGQFTEKLVVLR